jgi:AcrR family transcriptional regulator
MATRDRRVRRTQRALAGALLELAGGKPYQDVTIREIAERADVGYATFFRHYASKEALLLEVLSTIVADLARLLEPTAEQGRLAEAGRQLFEYVREHRDALAMLFAAQRSSGVQVEVRREVVARVLASRAFRPGAGLPRALAAHHLAVASLALVEWWLEQGMPYGPARMGAIYARLVVAPVGPD